MEAIARAAAVVRDWAIGDMLPIPGASILDRIDADGRQRSRRQSDAAAPIFQAETTA
jgi:hypothetical protein